VERIYAFFGLEGDARAIGEAEVRPPDTLGRWRTHKLADELTRIGEPTLGRFGYL
jgi:hypothetical protein